MADPTTSTTDPNAQTNGYDPNLEQDKTQAAIASAQDQVAKWNDYASQAYNYFLAQFHVLPMDELAKDQLAYQATEALLQNSLQASLGGAQNTVSAAGAGLQNQVNAAAQGAGAQSDAAAKGLATTTSAGSDVLSSMGNAQQQAANTALGVANLIAQLRGPQNAFTQQRVMEGLDASGLSNAVDALAGRGVQAGFQAPQGTPMPATLGGMASDLANAGPGNSTIMNLLLNSAAGQNPMQRAMAAEFGQGKGYNAALQGVSSGNNPFLAALRGVSSGNNPLLAALGGVANGSNPYMAQLAALGSGQAPQSKAAEQFAEGNFPFQAGNAPGQPQPTFPGVPTTFGGAGAPPAWTSPSGSNGQNPISAAYGNLGNSPLAAAYSGFQSMYGGQGQSGSPSLFKAGSAESGLGSLTRGSTGPMFGAPAGGGAGYGTTTDQSYGSGGTNGYTSPSSPYSTSSTQYVSAMGNPNQWNLRNWNRMTQDTQNMMLNAFQDQGWSPTDILGTIGQEGLSNNPSPQSAWGRVM